jgi:Arm DNA-binding domain
MKRVGSKLRRITLGRYPDLSLAEARAQARTMLADIRDMEKPVAHRSPPSRDRAGPPGGRGVDRTRGIMDRG